MRPSRSKISPSVLDRSPATRFSFQCVSCGRNQTRHLARPDKAQVRCRHCRTVNPGPAMLRLVAAVMAGRLTHLELELAQLDHTWRPGVSGGATLTVASEHNPILEFNSIGALQ